jgi:hypothetical protein
VMRGVVEVQFILGFKSGYMLKLKMTLGYIWLWDDSY